MELCAADKSYPGDAHEPGETGGAPHRGRAWGGRKGGRPRAVLSELFGNIAPERLQIEVSAVRFLSQLFGFLLREQPSAVSDPLSA